MQLGSCLVKGTGVQGSTKTYRAISVVCGLGATETSLSRLRGE